MQIIKGYRSMRYLMGGFIEIEAQQEEEQCLKLAVEEAFAEIRRVENLLSRFLPESLVSFLNQWASIFPVPVSEEIFQLLQECRNFSERTEGAFDITVGPLVNLWARAAERNEIPSATEIKTVSQNTGYRHIILDPLWKTVYFDRTDLKIDLGAVGKGYALDRAVAILRGRGIFSAIINARSSIYCFGDKEASFGIANPHQAGSIAAIVALQNNALSTSANNERFFKIRGKKFGHIINPQTGYPESTGLSSVSVIAGSAKDCELLSTAIFLLGIKGGKQLLQDFPEYKIVLLPRSGFFGFSRIIHLSRNFSEQ